MLRLIKYFFRLSENIERFIQYKKARKLYYQEGILENINIFIKYQ